MSGISFKITAPARPTLSTAASSSSSSSRPRPESRSTSGARTHHDRRAGHYDDDDDSEGDDGAFGRRDSKRRRLDDDDEEVVEFGRNGATSKNAKPKPAAPLVIPALPNKDWRKAAEELRAGRNPHQRTTKRDLYLPERGGGMTRPTDAARSNSTTAVHDVADADAINTEEVVGGLETREKKKKKDKDQEEDQEEIKVDEAAEEKDNNAQLAAHVVEPPPRARVDETEEQRAMRELLGEAAGGSTDADAAPELAAIASAADKRNGPVEEADAFKRDVDSRPDEASLDDYARVPVGAFGLAMLRGMGWQPGQAASRSGRGAIEAHVPSSRPSLLGIGAKPMAEALGGGGDGTKGNKASKPAAGKSRREEMKFMPLIKQAREGSSASASGRNTPLPITDGSASSSRRPSRSPPPASSSSRRERGYDRDRRDDRGSSRYDRDDRRSSRRDDDERRRSRYDDDDDRSHRSGRRDDGERRRDYDRDGGRRRDSARDDRDGRERSRSSRR
ncbi:hypothetical protein JCM11491_003722 [Sporobolomyces phaffii]